MTEQTIAQMPTTPAGKMLSVLGGIAMLSGFLVVLSYQLSKPAVEENQRIGTEKMVFKVIPGSTQRQEFLVTKDGVRPADGGEGTLVHAAYDKDGKLIGIAIKGAAQGYADLVNIIYNYDPNCSCIRGFEVVTMRETPGLGDKIITNADFQANFKALDAQLNSDGSALANDIATVKHGTKRHPWQIDAISGATVTSKAVGKGMNQSAQALLPQIMKHLDAIQQGATKRSNP